MLRDDRQNHLGVCKKLIKSLGLRKNQEWLLIADVFKGQWTPALKKEVADLNEKMVPVPNSTTNHFQTLELTVNRSGKGYLRKSTQNLVTSEVIQRQLESGKQPENVQIDPKLSVMSEK